MNGFQPGTSTTHGTPIARIYSSCHEIHWEDWNRVVSPDDTLWNKDFFHSIEQSSASNLNPYYVLIYQDDSPIFCAYFQQIEFDTKQIGAFTQDLDSKGTIRQWMFYRLSDVARRIVQLFKFRLLVSGNSLLTSETGFRACPSIPAEQHQELLALAIEELSKTIPRSIGVLIKDAFIADRVETWDSYWTDKKYHKFFPDPEMVLPIPTEWQSWEEYLGAMSSKYRQRARSAYKKSDAIEDRELSLSDLDVYEDRMNELFQEVVTSEKFALTEISSNYFRQLKTDLRDRLIILGYFLKDQLVGFATHIVSDEGPMTHFVGFETELNHSMKIYQRMLYDQVKLGLSQKVETLSLGRTAMEIKSCVGALPQAGPCYLHLRPKWMNRLAKPIMSNLKIESWTPRNPFKEPVTLS